MEIKKNLFKILFSIILLNIETNSFALIKNKIIVSVENRALDVYLDGKLVKTCIMPGIPQVSSSNILLTPNGGFSGFTNLFQYYSYPINPKKAYDIFKSGLKSNIPRLSLGNYGFKLSFTKDNNEVKSLEI